MLCTSGTGPRVGSRSPGRGSQAGKHRGVQGATDGVTSLGSGIKAAKPRAGRLESAYGLSLPWELS